MWVSVCSRLLIGGCLVDCMCLPIGAWMLSGGIAYLVLCTHQDFGPGNGLKPDGRVQWHKIGVFRPLCDETKLVSIVHAASGRNGTIPAHVNIGKAFSLVSNHNEGKAQFERLPTKVPCSYFFPKHLCKNNTKGGQDKYMDNIIIACRRVLETQVAARATASGSSTDAVLMEEFVFFVLLL